MISHLDRSPTTDEPAFKNTMTNSQRLATVRDRLLRWIADQDRGPEDSDASPSDAILSESILIREGFYCGRRFNLGSHRAVWFLEEDELKIYTQGGDLECVLPSEEITKTQPDVEQEREIIPIFSIDQDVEVAAPADDSDGEIRRAA